MSEIHNTYARVQGLRIQNLETQVHLIQNELRRLRDGILQKTDIEKLISFKEKLKELNVMLVELRSYYGSMQQTIPKKKKSSEAKTNKNHLNEIAANHLGLHDEAVKKPLGRENAGYDQTASFTELPDKKVFIDKEAQRHDETIKGSDPFKTCKQLMGEIRTPGSILGNYLTRLQDFRADPELRRQRWERKQQQKLQQLQLKEHIKPTLEDKGTATEEIATNEASYLKETKLQNSDPKQTHRRNENSSCSQYAQTGSSHSFHLTIINQNLAEAIEKFIKDIDKRYIVLTLVSENDFYHLSVSRISNGQQIACVLATEEAVQDAKQQHLFEEFLTFYVVDAANSKSQRDQVLGHLFEYINMDAEKSGDEGGYEI